MQKQNVDNWKGKKYVIFGHLLGNCRGNWILFNFTQVDSAFEKNVAISSPARRPRVADDLFFLF